MDAVQEHHAMKLSIAEGAMATAMGTLLSGVFLTGFALHLHASQVAIGTLASLPFLANVAQLFGAHCLARSANRKRLCVWSLAASRLIWFSILVIPWYIVSESQLVICLIAVVAVSSVLSSLGGIAWLSWIKDLVPQKRQLGFLGLRNQFDTVLALIFSIAGAMFLDWWAVNEPGSMNGFLIVLGSGLICGLLGIPLLNAIPDPADDCRKIEKSLADVAPTSKELTVVPKAEAPRGNFRRLMLFYGVWNLSSNLATPFFAVFMLKVMSLSFWQVTALNALAAIVGLVANRYWTRLGNRFGTRPVIFLATLGDALYPLWWLFLSSDSTWALPLIFLSGVFNPPVAVGPSVMVLQNAPQTNASYRLAIFSATMGPIITIAAMLGGWLVSLPATADIAEPSVVGLKIVFLLSCVGRLTSLFLLSRVQEPGASSVGAIGREAWAALQRRLYRAPAAIPAEVTVRSVET